MLSFLMFLSKVDMSIPKGLINQALVAGAHLVSWNHLGADICMCVCVCVSAPQAMKYHSREMKPE